MLKCNIEFVYNCTITDFDKYLRKKYKYGIEPLDYFKNAVGTNINVDEWPCRFVWLEELSNDIDRLGTAVHEITHASVRILEDKGIPYSKQDNADESLAYLIDYFFRELINFDRGNKWKKLW